MQFSGRTPGDLITVFDAPRGSEPESLIGKNPSNPNSWLCSKAAHGRVGTGPSGFEGVISRKYSLQPILMSTWDRWCVLCKKTTNEGQIVLD